MSLQRAYVELADFMTELCKKLQSNTEKHTLHCHADAMLLAADHADRRSLARDAATGGWSVRVLEDRARAANDRDSAAAKRSAKAMHPDQERACEEIAEALAKAFGRDVVVRPKGTGYRVQLEVSGADDAAALARATRLAAVR